MASETAHDEGWDVRIETQEDAKRFARIGGYAGFTYIFITTFFAVFGIMGGLSQMEKMPELGADVVGQQTGAIGFMFARFVLYWVLSWRTHSGNGIIAAPVLCLLIVGEIFFATFGMVSKGFIPGLLLVILAAVFGSVLVAGIKGNWANRAFRRGIRT